METIILDGIPTAAPERLVRAADVAIFMSLNVSTVRQMARKDLPCYRIGAAVLFRMSEVQDYLAKKAHIGKMKLYQEGANNAKS